MKKLRPLLVLPVLMAAAGCDLPLDLPRWNTAWTVPGTVDTVATRDLLPQGVAEAPEGFLVDPVNVSRSVLLGDVCPICTCFQGPIPPITLEPQEWVLPLPGGLIGAALRQGRARLVLHNEIPFDLLDDGQGGEGFLLIRLVDRFSRATLDSLRVTGPLPPGDSVEASFDLSGRDLSRRLALRVEGVTPGSGCDQVALDPEDGIRSEVALEEVEASEVTVIVPDEALRLSPRSLELPEAVADRLRPDEARVLLQVEVESSVELAMEILLSVGTGRDELFGREAALFTPILVAPASGPDPTTVEKLLVLDLAPLLEADSIFIDTRSRVEGNRTVLIRGGEAVRYTATLRAELPSR